MWIDCGIGRSRPRADALVGVAALVTDAGPERTGGPSVGLVVDPHGRGAGADGATSCGACARARSARGAGREPVDGGGRASARLHQGTAGSRPAGRGNTVATRPVAGAVVARLQVDGGGNRGGRRAGPGERRGRGLLGLAARCRPGGYSWDGVEQAEDEGAAGRAVSCRPRPQRHTARRSRPAAGSLTRARRRPDRVISPPTPSRPSVPPVRESELVLLLADPVLPGFVAVGVKLSW